MGGRTISMTYIIILFILQVKAGFMMNIICVAVLTLGINTWGYAYFDLGTLPRWASSTTENTCLNIDW